jgi:hypothetical protein
MRLEEVRAPDVVARGKQEGGYVDPSIDVLRTYIRNTQITSLDLQSAQKQSRDCSNNQQTNQTAISARFQRSQ